MAIPVTLALKPGCKAPPFSVLSTDGSTLNLADFFGKPVVLYFYPRDDTPGCTKEACGFRDRYSELRKEGAVVLGVSADPIKSHVKYTKKFSLPYPLLADEDKSIAQAYGVWGEKVFMGRKYLGIHRVTFLIGPDQRLEKIWTDVKPDEHAKEVLLSVIELGKAGKIQAC